MTFYLCIDSALGAGSVALYREGELLAFEEIPGQGAQAKFLVSTVESCLGKQQLTLDNISTIYCTVGPGGFTGIRIALASAQAFGFTLDIPVVGVSTLACVAAELPPACGGKGDGAAIDQGGARRNVPHSNNTATSPPPAPPQAGGSVMIPAGKGKAYTQRFSFPDITPLGPPELVDIEQPLEKPHMDARSIGKLLAMDSFSEHHALPADPLYIRPPDAVIPQKLAVKH